MSSRSPFLDAAVETYVREHTVREAPVLQRLREVTAPMSGAGMQIGPDQGQFMALLAKLVGVRRYLELGVFTGYSSLVMALAMPLDGRIVALDVSQEFTAVARRFWREAGVEAKIDLRLGPALAALEALRREPCEPFDMAFIDADKENVGAYYEGCLALLRPGGLIAVDNVLWSGRVADPQQDDPETRALRTLNARVRDDARVDCALLPVGDGLLLARKRAG